MLSLPWYTTHLPLAIEKQTTYVFRTLIRAGTGIRFRPNSTALCMGIIDMDLSSPERRNENLNLFSAVRITRMVLPFMQKQHWGRILNIASESGIQPDPNMPHYNASKAALINLPKSLSKAYAKDGILVNSVSPAFIKTPLVEQMLADQAKARHITEQAAEEEFLRVNRPHIELRRAGTPEEVAAAVVFLASEAASFITGANLRVDGGSVASI